MKAVIKAIEYVLPHCVLTNDELATQFPDWPAAKIENKTGIRQRHIADENVCASDLAVAAAEKLFATGVIARSQINYILLCTQSPDFLLPTTACLIQQRLGIPTSCGALDFNLGCSGFVYGLGLAKGLIETGQASNVLLITAETYSKYINPLDKSVRTLFGDAAAATLIGTSSRDIESIGPFVFGTDGSGAGNLIVPTGGSRKAKVVAPTLVNDDSGNQRDENNLYMNGPEIFKFTLKAVPEVVAEILSKTGLDKTNVDYWVFHQANKFMLDHLRKKLEVPEERFPCVFADCGNTVSSTIPIVLKDLQEKGQLQSGQLLALVGFGVGYSWAATITRWE